jgi:hypothetical protein
MVITPPEDAGQLDEGTANAAGTTDDKTALATAETINFCRMFSLPELGLYSASAPR